MPTNEPTPAEVQAICAETGNWISPEGAEYVSNICRAYRAEYLDRYDAQDVALNVHLNKYRSAIKTISMERA